ncbi:hypothetical protein VII00023_07289 [Vibrio ichthyoenteri ATCC 700023]|uniref:GtrA/DPMS transmembrane domain-containing protein n=1 Tax=Vibrio ichthyoenteri ATCC 700023 TaxID=870968 RepID=F9RXT3_9VIBR|nr:GtrA family protein [Vibrio ichthyoenteri]EGU47464.1 hypothetical protein VII00023_07289 [Vibrio ichthyoenteri ATCC 700023]
MMAIFGHRMVRFALVGGVGFIVDALMFAVLFYLCSMPLWIARGGAFFCAASVTWLGNRCFTFKATFEALSPVPNGTKWFELRIEPWTQWLKFLGSALMSAIPNFVMFQMVIMMLGAEGFKPVVALAMGVLTGMVSNYFLSSRWVFKAVTDKR